MHTPPEDFWDSPDRRTVCRHPSPSCYPRQLQIFFVSWYFSPRQDADA
jgi:hypothetical protein